MARPPADEYPPLISLAVHELRTPASVVGGYLRMLQRDVAEPLTERQRKMIDEAEKSCARMVALIAEMSELGKLDDGRISFATQPVDLSALVAAVVPQVHEAEDRDVHLVLSGTADPLPISGDDARLRAAFDTIFRAVVRERIGSVQVCADRGRATIEGRAHAVVVVADVTDIEDVVAAPRGIFNDKRGGLGLALPIARRVVEAHGGRIWSPVRAGIPSDMGPRSAAIVALPLAV